MNEFYLALKMMTEARYKWPMPPEPPAVVRAAEPQADRRSPEQWAADDELLRKYGECVAKCGTGRLVLAGGFYVPELKADCEVK